MKKTYVIFLLILSLFLVYYKTEIKEKFPNPTSSSYPDKIATSNGYVLSGSALNFTSKYTKAAGPNSVLFVEVDTIKGTSVVYSVYTVRHDEKKKSLADK